MQTDAPTSAVDPFGNDAGEEGHEGDGHRQAIPQEPVVVGIPVVVGGPHPREGDHAEEYEVGATLPRLMEAVRPATEEVEHAPDPDQDEHGKILEAARQPERVRHSPATDNNF